MKLLHNQSQKCVVRNSHIDLESEAQLISTTKKQFDRLKSRDLSAGRKRGFVERMVFDANVRLKRDLTVRSLKNKIAAVRSLSPITPKKSKKKALRQEGAWDKFLNRQMEKEVLKVRESQKFVKV